MKKYQISNIKYQLNRGFTIPELLVTMGIFAILASFVTVNLLRSEASATIHTAVDTFVADVKLQQIKAMSGDTEGGSGSESFGIYLSGSQYVMFKGSVYNPNDSLNKNVELPEGVQFTNIAFPQATIVFSERSGEVAGYSSATDTVVIADTASGQQRTIELNQLGTIIRTQ